MNLKLILIFLVLLAALLIRILQLAPLSKPTPDPELENLASNFIPARQFFVQKINQVMPQPQAGLLNGILVGKKSDLPKELNTVLRRTSTIHIVVVSGQNLTILIGFVMSLVSLIGRKKTILLSFFIIIIYSLLTGMQIPVLRAAIMVGISLIAQLMGRDKESPWILFITALLMLIYEPNWLLSISFQLSFLATVGVIILSPEIVKKLNFLPGFVKEDFGVSLAAQALTWPIIAANFHQASIIGLLANAFVLWTVSLVMISGIFTLIGSLINLTLGSILALIPAALLTYFIYILNLFNSLPFASIYVNKTSPLVWIGYYLIMFALYLWLKQSNHHCEEPETRQSLTALDSGSR